MNQRPQATVSIRSAQRKHARKPSTLSCSVLALALASAWPVLAQTAPEQTVLITGQAEATDRALQDQQAADNVVSVVRADGIGRLPDKNAAEALQRVPGVSIERDQGEGRYVRVRGLGPDLNSVTLNGSLVPSPERDRRAVMLDVLPSSLVRALVVSKTLLPDQDANSLGGSIDVQTVSAFDHKSRFLSLDAGVGHESNTGRSSPNLALVWSDLFLGGRLGVAAGVNLEERKFGSDNVETGGAWEGDALEEFERRDYRITRQRNGLALNVEYRPAAGTQVYARLVHSRFSDDEERQAHVIEFDDAQVAGATGDAESVRELKARKETQTIRSLVLGAEVPLGDWKFGAAGGFSRSSEDTPQHVAAAVFEAEDLFADVGFVNGRQPRLVAPASINQAASYALKEIELERSKVVDSERNLRLDLGRSLQLGGVTTSLKFGAKASHRSKTNRQTTWVLEDLEDDPFALTPAQLGLANFAASSPAYPFGAFGPAIAAAPVQALAAGVDQSGFIDDEESTVNNFDMKERIRAAYVQAGFDLGATSVLVGLRHEGTRLRAAGTGIEEGTFAPIVVTQKYGHWLPGLHLRHDLDARTSVRAAWTHAVVRPSFGQLAPGYVIDGDEASFGNPELKPLRSANLDFGVERSLGYASVVSAYAFHKSIRDFVYQTDLAGTGRWASFDEAVTQANGSRATVSGLELAAAMAFKQLPAPWNGLVLGANATFSQSRATVGRYDGGAGAVVQRRIPLPSQSKQVLNLVLGYESQAFGVRLAANHKSKYLLEVGDVLDAGRDLYVDAQTQLDLSARYSISKQVSVGFEALNLNDAAYYVYGGTRSRNAQYETYGRTLRINLKFALL